MNLFPDLPRVEVRPHADERTGRKLWQVLVFDPDDLFPDLPARVVWSGQGKRKAKRKAAELSGRAASC